MRALTQVTGMVSFPCLRSPFVSLSSVRDGGTRSSPCFSLYALNLWKRSSHRWSKFFPQVTPRDINFRALRGSNRPFLPSALWVQSQLPRRHFVKLRGTSTCPFLSLNSTSLLKLPSHCRWLKLLSASAQSTFQTKLRSFKSCFRSLVSLPLA